MVDHRAIMSLLFKHRSYTEITASVKCSRRDVSMVKKAIESGGITAEQLRAVSEADLAELFPDRRSKVSSEYVQPDFAKVVAAMKSNWPFTVQQAWTRYMDAAGDPGKKYWYSQFAVLFGRFAESNDVVATLRHEPGKSMFVDWVGEYLTLWGPAILRVGTTAGKREYSPGEPPVTLTGATQQAGWWAAPRCEQFQPSLQGCRALPATGSARRSPSCRRSGAIVRWGSCEDAPRLAARAQGTPFVPVTACSARHVRGWASTGVRAEVDRDQSVHRPIRN